MLTAVYCFNVNEQNMICTRLIIICIYLRLNTLLDIDRNIQREF